MRADHKGKFLASTCTKQDVAFINKGFSHWKEAMTGPIGKCFRAPELCVYMFLQEPPYKAINNSTTNKLYIHPCQARTMGVANIVQFPRQKHSSFDTKKCARTAFLILSQDTNFFP